MDLVKKIALALLILVEGTCSFTIGAFNIQIFGEKKAGNVEVMEHIVKVSRQYTYSFCYCVSNSKLIFFFFS